MIQGGEAQTIEFDPEELTEWLNTLGRENGLVTLMVYGIGQNCTVASRESDTKPVLYLEYDPTTDTGIADMATESPCAPTLHGTTYKASVWTTLQKAYTYMAVGK